MRIVHVTDLHIADPEAELEHLRRGHFREYLRVAAREIRGADERSVDALIVTGDFVHRGDSANFPHAMEVVTYLKQQLGVADGRVYVCPGNHDIIQELEFRGASDEARTPFRRATAVLDPAELVDKVGDRANLFKLGDSSWVITLDTTLFSGVHPIQELIANGSDPADARANWIECPGFASTPELDAIVAWFDQGPIGSTDPVFMVAHYPVDHLIAQIALYTDDTLWTRRHVWAPGQIITRRVEQIGRAAPLIWLGGDVHQGSQNGVGNTVFLVTGRLGTKVDEEYGTVMREIRLVEIDESQSIRTNVLEYRTDWGKHAIIGEWRWKTLPDDVVYVREELAGESQQHLEAVEEPHHLPQVIARSKLNELDDTLSQMLLTRIRHERLYHLGRFETTSERTALGWVSIGPLLTGQAVLRTSLHAMARRIRMWQDETVLIVERTVLIGIDCWGSALAAQLSLLSGAPVSIVAAREHGTSPASMGEFLRADAISPDVDTAILVTDAVATGGTLIHVREEVERVLSRQLKWYALSLIADPLQYPYEQLAFIEEHSTGCSQLRLPVIPTESLPDRAILPALIRFNDT